MNKQLRMTPLEIFDIDSRFFRTKAWAPGSSARTWPMTYLSTTSVPKMRLPIVSNNSRGGNRASIEKYETAAAAAVRSLRITAAGLSLTTFHCDMGNLKVDHPHPRSLP